MHEELWQQLGKLEGKETSQRAKCQYLHNPKRYIIKLLNNEYTVNLTNRQILSTQGDSAHFLEQLCLLVYLINAKDLPLAEKLVKAESLPTGEFFFRGLHRLPTEKLAKSFGEHPELLYQAGKRFGAKKREFGNASIELYVLPRLPLTIVIWAADEEFSSRASILFDETAGSHMPLDALLAAVKLAVDALVSPDAESS